MDRCRESNVQLKLPDCSQADIDQASIWKDDLMGRKQTAEQFDVLLSGQRGPLNVCIDGAWGTGKTFFLRRFKSQWEVDGGRAIYFNAWEDDFLPDPLVALIGQIWSLIKGGTLSEVGRAVSSCAGGLVKSFVLDKIGISEEKLKTGTESAFDEYLSLAERRNDLRNRLTEVAQRIAEETKRPLLFIVDELDRCRPTFAIEVLERIKHLFAIKDLVFVFGVDKEQLQRLIRSVYGNIDASNYLHRFFDVTLTLSDIHIAEYLRTLFQRYGVQEYIARINQRVDFDRFTDAFCSLLVHYKMSFREAEVCARQYMLLAFSRSTSAATAVIFSGIAVALRMKNLEAYRHYIAWDIPVGQLVDMIYGNLAGIAELNESLPAVEFICYLYEQALFGEVETEQAHELTRIFDAVEKDESVDLNSPYIAQCFRSHWIGDLKNCIRHIRGWGSRMGYRGFKAVLREIDSNLDRMSDISL